MEIDTKIGYKEAIKAHEMHILIRTIRIVETIVEQSDWRKKLFREAWHSPEG